MANTQWIGCLSGELGGRVGCGRVGCEGGWECEGG